MEANGKTSITGEISMTENKSGEVVLTISDEVEALIDAAPGTPREAKPRGVSITELELPHRNSVDSYPENAYFMPSPKSPPNISIPETLTRRKTLTRAIYSKPKSRFGEQIPIIDHNMFDDITDLNMFDDMPEPVGQTANSPMRISARASSNGTPRTLSISPITPLMRSPGEEIYKKVKWVKMKVLFQWALLLFLVGCIVASLTIPKLENFKIWSLELWKWLVLITVIVRGMLVINWLMHFIVLLIRLNFMSRKKTLYLVHGLNKNVQVCIWLIVVLATWTSLFNSNHIDRSRTAAKVLDYLTWTIVALLVGSVLWLLKNLLLKILPTSFHIRNFFDRIQESVYLQYVIYTLSGPPVMESKSHFSLQVKRKGKDAKTKKEVIDVSKLKQLTQEKVSTWTMTMLVDVISNSLFSTISNELEESAYYGSGFESTDKEITNEMEAIDAAYHIFRNVAQPGSSYIDDIDLRRFMIKEEVDMVFPIINVWREGQIDRETLTEWVLNVYKGRKALAHALDETKSAVYELNKLVTVVLIVIMIIVWLLLTGIATTKVLVLLSSQLVVAAFIFGNTCKNVFEAIVFVFIMHPFDVGDRCVVDGVQMIVEEMHILSTVFLRFDNEVIYYPNSVLATKPISNLNRSPDMGDSVEFCIDFATPIEKIELLKRKIIEYLVKNPQLWHLNHNFVVKEIENENKIKMALFFNHTINFQDYNEKNKRRGELILELKKIFEDLKIKCYLLPQEVQLPNPETTTPTGPDL